MKKFILLQCFFLGTIVKLVAQDVSFNPPFFQQTVKGDMIVVGNSILNIGSYPANTPYVGSYGHNARIDLNYIDVDGDNSTFNSSSANVVEPSSTCAKKVVKAYLYWAAAYTEERVINQSNPSLEKAKFKNVKFKVGSGAYHDLTGTVIYDGGHEVSSTLGGIHAQKAYVYRAEVTNLLSSIGGIYTVGNIQAPHGKENSGVGYAAGWTLVIVYEDLARESRNISLFNGFSVVRNGRNPNINISGFKTVPSGPVKAKIGFAALEGELGIAGDQLYINGKKLTSVPDRDGDNFFNSKVTNEGGENLNRTPASTNLLGFDIGIFNLPNNSKDILGNNATTATISPKTVQDSYYPFFFAFNVEVISPHVVIEKRVFNAANQDVTNATTVPFGSSLRYKIRFRNTGNDHAKDLVITDVFPSSLQNKVTGINVPSGVNVTAYNPATREIKFQVPNNLVQKGSAWQEISFGVQVANSCDDWRDPCANVIENSASATYNGVENPTAEGFTAKSFPQTTSCDSGTAAPTLFTVATDFSQCAYKETITLCQANALLTAAEGFDSYKWEKIEGTNKGQKGTSRTLTVSEAGTYKVTKVKTGCSTMYEIYEVKPNPVESDHPIHKMIENRQINGELYICPDTGQYYPQLYLCGANASINLRVNVSNAINFVWQKKGNCNTAESNRFKECPPSLEVYNCNWTDVHTTNGTTTQHSFNQEGDYRLVVTYSNGSGNCVVYYYFKITKNNLSPKAEVTDIVCTTKGRITIKDVPATGYQYALLQGTTTITNYQNNPYFDINSQGTYRVLVKQTVTKTTTVPCVFEIDGLYVKKRDPQLKVTVTPMACANNKGSMRIELTDAPYTPYSIVIRTNNQSGGTVTKVTSASLVEFTNYFNAGRYHVSLENTYGCNVAQTVEVKKITELKAVATVLSPIMCGTGVIRVTASGGTKGNTYQFTRDGATYYNNFTGDYYDFTVTSPGTYNFTVVDQNNCTAQSSVSIQTLPAPTFTITDALTNCGANAKITFSEPQSTVSYTYEYSIDDITFQSGREFINLMPGGIYTPTLRYKYGTTASCTIISTRTMRTAIAGSLIASAGIERLVGCGTGTNEDKALVRFSNVQGGQEPYLYNFGDGVWTTTRERWLTPGTYNLSVKDAIDCARTNLNVVVPNKITEPIFTPLISYDCLGKGTVTVANNKGTYTYTYELDGVPKNNNVFSNLTPGIHTITIKYADTNPPTKNVLFLEDFGEGNDHVKTPYINGVYFFEPQDGGTVLYNGNGGTKTQPAGSFWQNINDGEYAVTNRMNPSIFLNPVDHTKKTNGRILFVNIGNSAGIAGILYQRKMVDIIPNKPIRFSVAFYNLNGGNGVTTNSTDPIIRLELYKSEADILLGSSKALAFNHIGNIPGHKDANDWKEYNVELNPGNNTTLYAVVRSYSDVIGGNDLAIDDIYLYQEPESCGFTHTLTINIDNNKAFGVDPATEKVIQPKCFGQLGEYQVTLKNASSTYYVSKDGGAFVATTGNPFRWTNLNGGVHTVKIRAEQNNANCEVTRNFTITVPSDLTVTAGNVILGCNGTTNITATATGGTGTKQFSLRKGATVLFGYQNSPVFSVTQIGSYTVYVRDANNCEKNTTVNVLSAPTLTLTATTNATNNNYCLQSGVQGKVEVEVRTSDNTITAPYVFQHNGVTKSTQNTPTYIFNNLNVGIHTFTVTDKYGCRATYRAEIKAPLSIDGGIGATIVKDITCDTPPTHQGKISLKVKDGYAPYRYIVKRAGTVVQTIQNVVGNTAIYETATPGVYTIEVSDSKGCVITGAGTLVAAVAPTVTITTTSIGCYGANNGTISLTIVGGKAPYKVFLDTVDKGSQLVFTNLAAKNYIVEVVDANNCKTTQNVTISQPANPLQAFAGVSQLIGCGTGTNKDKAEVSITNPSGGTAPYQYKFSGNYSNINRGWLPAGVHTVYVKDANSCELALTVTVTAKIPEPTATTYTVTNYDCTGKGTVVFTGVPNNYNYTFEIDGKTATGTTATITGLAPGSYTVTIRYKDANPPASSILIQDDFGIGEDTCSTNVSPQIQCGPGLPPTSGRYVIGSNSSVFIQSHQMYWSNANDHTNPTNNKSRMLLIDIGNVGNGDVLYHKTVNINANRKIKYKMFVMNLEKVGMGGALPDIKIRLVDPITNAQIGQEQDYGTIARSSHPNDWHEFSGELNPGNITQVRIEIRTKSWAGVGCDMAVDDIFVYQEPESCEQEITKQVIVPMGNEFKASVVSQTNASCRGGEGKATFKIENLGGSGYQILGVNGGVRSGVGYSTAITTPTFEVDNLRVGINTITFNNRTCSIVRTVTITEPDQLTLTATVSEPAKCSNNNKARVTLTAGGGTPPYKYYYQSGVHTQVQTSNIFTDVLPGTPTFIVEDKNGCVVALQGAFVVATPTAITLTTSVTTCYSNNSDGEIGVKINSGNGNYKVRLNQNAAISLAAGATTHTFTGLTQGTYSLTVTDGYGCSTSTQVRIYPSLNSTVRVTHQSSCNTSAKIEVIASGGAGIGQIEYAYKLGNAVPISIDYNTVDTSKVIPQFATAVQTWTVYVRSAGCVKTHQVVIKKADDVTFTAATVTPTCQGSATGNIILKDIKGDGNFKVSYGNAGTPVIATYAGITTNTYTISNIVAGVYSVTVTDKYGCNATQSVTLADMPALTATITLSATVGDCLSIGSAATLTLTMGNDAWTSYRAGGNQIYYDINNSNTWHLMPNNPHYILPLSGVTEPGKTVQIRFATRPSATAPNVCSTAATAYVVPLPLGGISVTTDIDRFAYNCTAAGTQYFTATVTIDPSVGRAPFQFNVNGGNYEPVPATNSRTYVFTGLVVGRTYTFGVKDANGCETQYTGDIYANVATPAMTATLIANPACNGQMGQATIRIHRSADYTGTTTGTTFNWAIYEKQAGLLPGIPTPHAGTAVMPGAGQDATTISPSGPYALAPNKTYYVIVKEGTNCEWGSRDLHIRELATLSATVAQSATITCDSDGVLEVQNPTGGGGTYTYKVTPITPGVTFGAPIVTGTSRVQIIKDNIVAPSMPKYPNGAYSFQVKLEMEDQYGCSANLGNYTFMVTPSPDIAKTTILGCADGQYTLTIEPQVKIGAVGAVATGAELNGYQYSIDGGLDYQNSNVFANLVAGAYDVQIRDKSTGCIATKTVTITNALEADISLSTPLSCAGAAAVITVKVDNGSGDYEYSYTSPGGVTIGPTTIAQTAGEYKTTFNVTTVGVYTITVKDNNASGNCGSYTKTITVRAAEQPEITTSVRTVTCSGSNDGVIYLAEVNTTSVGAFSYAVQGPTGAVPATSIVNREVRGLAAGVYTITVTSANGCTNVYTATVKEPTALTISKTLIENTKQEFSCGFSGGVEQAQIRVPNGAIQGGIGPYAIEYLYGTVSGTGDSFTVGNIAGGTITITAVDANGCSTQTSVVIKPFESFDVDKIDFAVTTTGTCNASETITISAKQSSGAPFTGQLLYYQGATAPAGVITPTTGGWQTSNSFTIAPNNTYTFWVANKVTGCIASKLYISANPNNFNIVNPQVKNVGCKGANNGTATFTLSNTVNGHAYNVTVSPSAGTITPAAPFTATGTTATFNIAGLAPNTYTVTVKDNNTACEQTYSFKIEEPTAVITASVTVHQATCASAPTYNSGEIAIENVTGGWGTYQYYIGQAAVGLEVWTNTSVRTGLTPGTYRVLVKDNNGCATTLSNTVTIATPTTISGTLTVTNANCTNGTGAIGVRSVTGGEGANYLYQLIKDGVAQGGAQTSTEFQNLSAGNYQVAISDSWGCTTTLTQSVTLYEPVEGVGVRFIKQVTCTPSPVTGATVSVTYTGGNSPSLRYTLKNTATGVSSVSTTNGFTNIPAGNYEVSVYDVATGCPTQTYTFDVTDAATVSFTHTTTAVSCNGSSDGKLKITIPGSQTQTDYQINIVGIGFTRSETVNTTPKDIEFEGMPVGSYTVTLTSSRNCTATQTIIIGAPAALIVSNTTTVTTHYKCDTDNNAQQAIISAVAQGGTQPYKYNYQVFDGISTTTSGWINSSVYSLTSAGSATQTVIVNVEDANGCRAVYTPMVVPPLQRISAVNATRISTLSCNQSETVNFTIVGGKNLGYIVEVTANGSVATPTPSTQTLTAGTNVATVHFNAAGYYTIKVTDRDTDCYATVSYTVNEFRSMEVSAAQSKPVSCMGDSNGEITVTFSGYQGAISYQAYAVSPVLSPVGTLQTQIGSPDAVRRAVISGLPKGSYVVRMTQTDAPNCTVTSTEVMISEPTTALTASVTVTDRIKCGIGQTGAFKVEATGGWSNYEYRLSHNGTAHPVYGTYTSTSLFEGLSTGTYTVEVKDENGCATVVTQVMSAPAPIDATVTATHVNCFSDRTGVVRVQSITGGSGNYVYELKEKGAAIVKGAQTDTTFTGLDAREYVLIITDGWGCEAQIEVEVTEPAELNIVASIASPLTCNTPATISLVATGGTGAYTYYQVKGGATTIVGSSVTVNAADVGDYEFYVKDANGCSSKVSNKITIATLETLALHINTDDAFVKCNGESSARITFSATGALGNYQYKLYKGGVAQTVSATQVNATDWAFSGLASDTYQIEVTSVDCVQTATVNIGESPAFIVATATTDISCNTMRDGTISITVTGGAGDIQYAISPRLDRFVSEGYFTRLSRGEYIVRAQDKNGCFVDEIFKINEPDVLNAVIDKQTDEICYGAGDGTVSITITGGTQSYSTSIDDGAWTVGKTLYIGLSVGTHTITVKDARSCTIQVSVEIKSGVDLQPTATVTYGCGNNIVVNTIDATVNASYTGAVSFSLDGAAPVNSGRFTGVTPGVHSITFAHLNGCTTTLTVNVTAYNSLTATTATKTDMSCYGVNDGTITFAVSGATNSYTYTITPEAGTFDAANSQYTDLSAGTYVVKVRSNGEINCELEHSFTIIEPDLLQARASTVSETCYGLSDGQLIFSIQGGRAPYSYTLKSASGATVNIGTIATAGAVSTITNVVGDYILEYTDGQCPQSLQITVPSAPNLDIVDVKEQFNCSVVSTTYTTSYLRVEFSQADDKLTSSNTLYSVDGGVQKHPFNRFDGKYGYTDNISAGQYTLTVYYYSNVPGAPLCEQTWGSTVSLTRYRGLELKDISDPRAINKIKVQAVGGNSSSYNYTFNGYQDGSNEYMLRSTDPTTRVVGRKAYKTVVVEVVDANGCSSTLTIEKEYMKSVPPDFFTPNGDGQNDGWDPDRYRSYPKLTVDIYDRYGRYITSLRSGETWDGRYNGKELPTGDYWYILKTHEEGEDDQEYMGHFNLYRAAD